jgi:hypothetical protein
VVGHDGEGDQAVILVHVSNLVGVLAGQLRSAVGNEAGEQGDRGQVARGELGGSRQSFGASACA